ncbi:MAG: DUF4215 domain-containing protein [Myxococcales bacterium]|nr:DUF4215 domain-containing protein [Myxococcales bacterium]
MSRVAPLAASLVALALGACVEPHTPGDETDAPESTSGPSTAGESTVNTVTSAAPSTTEGVDPTETEGGCLEGSLGCQCTPSGTCDDGLSCIEAVCIPASCGNGEIEPEFGEECDPGVADDPMCELDCTLKPTCGNGQLEVGEPCDDGNDNNNDACLNTCEPNTCGDGYLWAETEECDDGADNDDEGACLSTCESARCGDAYLWQGVEGCDDGDQDNTDACLNNCTPATCGDGYVWQGAEECDDGNAIDDDGCGNDCTLAPTEFDDCGFPSDDGVWVEFSWTTQDQQPGDPEFSFSSTPGWGAPQWSPQAVDLFAGIVAGNDPIGWVLRVDNADTLRLRFKTTGLSFDSATVCVKGRSSSAQFGVNFDLRNSQNGNCGGSGSFSADWIEQHDGIALPDNCVLQDSNLQTLDITVNGGVDQLLGLRSVRLALHNTNF